MTVNELIELLQELHEDEKELPVYVRAALFDNYRQLEENIVKIKPGVVTYADQKYKTITCLRLG